jgi:protein LSM14
MGTENRRPTESYIAPSDVPYEFIIFRASEVKDIAVDQVATQAPPTRNVHDDPAVMTVCLLSLHGLLLSLLYYCLHVI